MPNKNYINGRNFEYKVKKIWEDQGYYVIRSAGSHGIADLVALDFDGQYTSVVLIQCKTRGVISKKDKEELLELCSHLGCRGYLAYRDEKGKFREDSIHDL